MKLTNEQLTSIFTNDKLSHDIIKYISQSHEYLPSYMNGVDVSLEGIQYYFEGCEEYILDAINNLIGVDLSNWNESSKYEDNYFEDFLQDMADCYSENKNMEW